MQDTSKQAQEIAVKIVRTHVPDTMYKVFVFGSRASAKAHPRSDIDIGIEGPAPLPYETVSNILEDIEEAPTLYSIDVVDFGRLPEKFKQTVRERVYT